MMVDCSKYIGVLNKWLFLTKGQSSARPHINQNLPQIWQKLDKEVEMYPSIMQKGFIKYITVINTGFSKITTHYSQTADADSRYTNGPSQPHLKITQKQPLLYAETHVSLDILPLHTVFQKTSCLSVYGRITYPLSEGTLLRERCPWDGHNRCTGAALATLPNPNPCCA